MPTYQTEAQNLAAVRFGSAKIEIGTSASDLQDLGMVTSVQFAESFTPVELKPDNAVKYTKAIREHVCKLSFEMWELDLTKLALLRGGIDTSDSTEAVSVSVSNEPHTLNDTDIVWLDYANGDGTEVNTIVVTDASATEAVRNTDYVIVVGTDGRTGIARVADSSEISDGEGVLVDYAYVPLANKTMSTGGLNTIADRYFRVTNINSAGKTFQIDIYKAKITGGLDFSYPADDGDDPLKPKIEVEGTYDITRVAGDQLFMITDEQGV